MTSSTKIKYTLWGRFFGLVAFEDSKTLLTKNFRLPIINKFFLKEDYNFSDENHFLTDKSYINFLKEKDFQHLKTPNYKIFTDKYLKKNKNISVLILGFDSIKFFSKTDNINYSLSLEKLINELNLSDSMQNLYQKTFNAYPIIPQNLKEIELQFDILQKVLKLVLNSKVSLEDELILTGEMIWSNWLHTYNLIALITKLLEQKFVNVEIDKTGKHFTALISKSFKEKNFEPDITFINLKKDFIKYKSTLGYKYCIKSNEDQKVLIHENNKIGIYDLKKNGYTFENFKLARFIYFCDTDLPNINNINQQILTNFNQKTNELVTSSWTRFNIKLPLYFEKEVVLNYSVELFNLSINDKKHFFKNDKIGCISYQKKNAISLKNFKKHDLTVVDKQYVNKGDLLAKKRNLFVREIRLKAPISGKIDFEELSEDNLIIYSKKDTTLTAPFSGNYKKIDFKQINIRANKLNYFPVQYKTQSTLSGIMIKSFKSSSIFDQFLLVDASKNLEDILQFTANRSLSGLVFFNITYTQMLHILNNKKLNNSHLEIVILDNLQDFVINLDTFFYLEENLLFFENENVNFQKFTLEKNHSKASEVSYFYKDFEEGEKISYLYEIAEKSYAKIFKTGAYNFLVLLENDVLNELTPGNIIP